MGMVVRTNTMALNAYRQLGMNNSAVAKSLEKLSSGFRINRAGDDAAGLAISEKMKAQIKGLETASANAQDGISLIQTAEGNLNEVHDMLNRMVELATKSANGTYTIQERSALQDEVNALLEEIDRISQSANFNGTNLLDGTMGLNKDAFAVGDAGAVKAVEGQPITVTYGNNGTEAATPTDAFHLSKTGSEQSKASFEIDLGDLAISQGTDATKNHTVSISVAGKTLASGNLLSNKAYTASDIAAAIFGNAANTDLKTGDGTAFPAGGGKYMDVGGLLMKVENRGSKLTFTYAGLTASGKDAADTEEYTTTEQDAFNAAVGNALKAGALRASVTLGTGSGSKVTGEIYHDVLNIEHAKVGKDQERAGMDVTFTDAILQKGSVITIDGKDFTIVSKKADEVGDTELNIDPSLDLTQSAAKTEALHSIIDQLSKKTTDNFTISAQNGTTIHIDQTVGTDGVYDTAEKLKAVVSVKGPSTPAGTKLTFTDASKLAAGDAIRVGDKTYTFGDGTGQIKLGTNGADALTGLKKALEDDGYETSVSGTDLTIYAKADDTGKLVPPAIIGGGLTLQIGDTADSFNKMTVAVANMSAKGLGLEDLKNDGITSEAKASNAIQMIKDAINNVSTTRASMGALQNRLEHTINNLDVAAENLSAANSRIRDTDMAKEMMNYTKMNVLVQSAQAMLAQANQQPQSVLQLLQ